MPVRVTSSKPVFDFLFLRMTGQRRCGCHPWLPACGVSCPQPGGTVREGLRHQRRGGADRREVAKPPRGRQAAHRLPAAVQAGVAHGEVREGQSLRSQQHADTRTGELKTVRLDTHVLVRFYLLFMCFFFLLTSQVDTSLEHDMFG